MRPPHRDHPRGSPRTSSRNRRRGRLALCFALVYLVVACAVDRQEAARQRLWWSALGPVLPHDSFPGDCALCHADGGWQSLRADFAFDHEAETGVPLRGAHAQASCLLCHNDRGPVAVFARQGCAGCHEDVHLGRLGSDCSRCHQESNWRPTDQFVRHAHTRFPLVGAHAVAACFRCHPGAEVGLFTPTDNECLTCHQDDLARANNSLTAPNHAGFGWVDRCDRCHLPRTWQQAEIHE